MSSSGPDRVDVVVNGAGPVGATLACRLVADGFRVLLIDRAPLPSMTAPSLDGRAYALSEGSRRLLASAGIWPHLPDRTIQPIREICVRDGRPYGRTRSPGLIFSESDADGPFGWMVEARELRGALNAALLAAQEQGLVLRAPDNGHFSFDDDKVRVEFPDGTLFAAGLAVAAEGRGSPLRAQAGIMVTKLPYRQCGIISIIAHEKPHEGRALEHFLPQGPFARLPLAGTDAHPCRSAIVWAESEQRAPRLHDLPDDAFAREIAARLGDDDIGALRPVGPRWIYPLSAQYAQRYIGPRLALAGDSAHGLHPIAGQGLNAGFKDIAALVSTIEDAQARRSDLGGPAVLTRYQRAARPAALSTLAACDGLERLFGNDNPALRFARGLGMSAFDRLPTLKRAFVRRAMGL